MRVPRMKKYVRILFWIALFVFVMLNMHILVTFQPSFSEHGYQHPELRASINNFGHLSLKNVENESIPQFIIPPNFFNSSASKPRTTLDTKNLEAIKQEILRINTEQFIHNLHKFPLHLTSESVVIVIQVHDRGEYLKLLLESLKKVVKIEKSLLIISHDVYSEEINQHVSEVDFCPVIQIFFPYSLQLYPQQFPGNDPKDCPRNMKKEEAMKKKCKNAHSPDKYGHYREAKYCQTKHHWFWKLHHVFDGIDVMKNYKGLVMLLEEDYYVTPDVITTLQMMWNLRNKDCKECKMLTAGNYDKSQNYQHNAGKSNMARQKSLQRWRKRNELRMSRNDTKVRNNTKGRILRTDTKGRIPRPDPALMNHLKVKTFKAAEDLVQEVVRNAEPPKTQADIDKPKTQADIDKPKTQTDIDKPKTQADIDKPKTQADIDKPKTQTDIDKPKTQADIDKPKTQADIDKPKTQADIDKPKTQADIDKPKTQTDIDKPKTKTDIDKPKTQADIDKPKTQADIDKPKTQTDIDKPKTQADIDKPKTQADIDKPKTQADIDKPKTQADIDKPKTKTDIDKPKTKTDIDKPKTQADIDKPKTQADIDKPKPQAAIDKPKAGSRLEIQKVNSDLEVQKVNSDLEVQTQMDVLQLRKSKADLQNKGDGNLLENPQIDLEMRPVRSGLERKELQDQGNQLKKPLSDLLLRKRSDYKLRKSGKDGYDINPRKTRIDLGYGGRYNTRELLSAQKRIDRSDAKNTSHLTLERNRNGRNTSHLTLEINRTDMSKDRKRRMRNELSHGRNRTGPSHKKIRPRWLYRTNRTSKNTNRTMTHQWSLPKVWKPNKSEEVEVANWISSRHNMGMTFTADLWKEIKKCAKEFCNFDDYNWDWTLQHVSSKCIPNQVRVLKMKATRVFHMGECGVHHKGKNCKPEEKKKLVQKMIDQNKNHLFPNTVTIGSYSGLKLRDPKPNGGWGDYRDRQLCLSFLDKNSVGIR